MQHSQNAAPFTAIHSTLSNYFDALYYCDIEKLRLAFHPKAIYATADEIPLLYRTFEEYVLVISSRQSPASRNETRRDYIDSIDIAGENSAFARVRCSIGTKDYIDFLSLIRTDNQWQIIAKIFHFNETIS